MKAVFLFCALSGLTVFQATTATANLLTNGSFEQPVVTTNFNFTGFFSFSGWSGFSTGTGNGGGNAGLVPGVNFGLGPFDGNQAFSFNGDNPPPGSFIEQTFSTIPGVNYTVSFSLGRNSGSSEQILKLEAAVFDSAGATLASFPFSPPDTVSYTSVSFNVVAGSAVSRLRFTDISSPNPSTDLFLDAVSVEQVPEPSSVAFLFCSAFYFLARRSKVGQIAPLEPPPLRFLR